MKRFTTFVVLVLFLTGCQQEVVPSNGMPSSSASNNEPETSPKIHIFDFDRPSDQVLLNTHIEGGYLQIPELTDDGLSLITNSQELGGIPEDTRVSEISTPQLTSFGEIIRVTVDYDAPQTDDTLDIFIEPVLMVDDREHWLARTSTAFSYDSSFSNVYFKGNTEDFKVKTGADTPWSMDDLATENYIIQSLSISTYELTMSEINTLKYSSEPLDVQASCGADLEELNVSVQFEDNSGALQANVNIEYQNNLIGTGTLVQESNTSSRFESEISITQGPWLGAANISLHLNYFDWMYGYLDVKGCSIWLDFEPNSPFDFDEARWITLSETSFQGIESLASTNIEITEPASVEEPLYINYAQGTGLELLPSGIADTEGEWQTMATVEVQLDSLSPQTRLVSSQLHFDYNDLEGSCEYLSFDNHLTLTGDSDINSHWGYDFAQLVDGAGDEKPVFRYIPPGFNSLAFVAEVDGSCSENPNASLILDQLVIEEITTQESPLLGDWSVQINGTYSDQCESIYETTNVSVVDFDQPLNFEFDDGSKATLTVSENGTGALSLDSGNDFALRFQNLNDVFGHTRIDSDCSLWTSLKKTDLTRSASTPNLKEKTTRAAKFERQLYVDDDSGVRHFYKP